VAVSAAAQPLSILDVPYIQQSESLCGGAAAAMVMRYWGATGIDAESFAPLVDRAAQGIRADDLLRDLKARDWQVQSCRGERELVGRPLAQRQPLIALIEDRPGYFHFVVVVAWANGRVMYHDPARGPFRVVREQTFERAWGSSDHWTMLMLPPPGGLAGSPANEVEAAPSPKSPCDDLVARGVRTAEAGDRSGALDVLNAAAEICPSASAPPREAAGVHALAGEWNEAGRLAAEAVRRDRSDQHAWRILATSAYVRGDSAAALTAWNAVGEPVVDLVNIIGLDRTRHSVASGLVRLEPKTVLTTARLAAASRRLGELPSAEFARINYRPLGEGRAAVEAAVIERPTWPTSRASMASIGVRLLSDRELSASVASLSGGGELITGSWRWWRGRPRLEASYMAPSRFGVWRAVVFGEEQTYGSSSGRFVESRRGGALRLSQWTSSMTRWEAGAGIDAWSGDARTVSLAAGVDQRLFGDRLSLRATGSLFVGSFEASTIDAGALWRSSTRHEGSVLLSRAGLVVASADAPHALWAGAGTGPGRDLLLRAHPLLDDGSITGEVFGRRLLYAGAEAQHWLKPVFKVVRIAPAVFIDVASANRRLDTGRAWQADLGAGIRFALPGSDVIRVDLGKGLRDGDTAVSIGWIRSF
jgi:hypothetical protein